MPVLENYPIQGLSPEVKRSNVQILSFYNQPENLILVPINSLRYLPTAVVANDHISDHRSTHSKSPSFIKHNSINWWNIFQNITSPNEKTSSCPKGCANLFPRFQTHKYPHIPIHHVLHTQHTKLDTLQVNLVTQFFIWDSNIRWFLIVSSHNFAAQKVIYITAYNPNISLKTIIFLTTLQLFINQSMRTKLFRMPRSLMNCIPEQPWGWQVQEHKGMQWPVSQNNRV